MPFYHYICDDHECTAPVQVRFSTVHARDKPRDCMNCGRGFLQRDFGATVKTIHTAPVPGTGNWKYARELEEKAERVKQGGGVSPNADAHISSDQQAHREKH